MGFRPVASNSETLNPQVTYALVYIYLSGRGYIWKELLEVLSEPWESRAASLVP